MTTFHEDIAQWSEEDPKFAYELALARAESSLGRQAAELREQRDMTQAELAARMGLRQPSIARLEGADRTPTVETLWKFASALDCEFVIGPGFSVRVATVDEAASAPQTVTGQYLVANPASGRNRGATWYPVANDDPLKSQWRRQITVDPTRTASGSEASYQGFVSGVVGLESAA